MRDQAPHRCSWALASHLLWQQSPLQILSPHHFPQTALIAKPVWELGRLWQTSLNTPDIWCEIHTTTATVSTFLSLHMRAGMYIPEPGRRDFPPEERAGEFDRFHSKVFLLVCLHNGQNIVGTDAVTYKRGVFQFARALSCAHRVSS